MASARLGGVASVGRASRIDTSASTNFYVVWPRTQIICGPEVQPNPKSYSARPCHTTTNDLRSVCGATRKRMWLHPPTNLSSSKRASVFERFSHLIAATPRKMPLQCE